MAKNNFTISPDDCDSYYYLDDNGIFIQFDKIIFGVNKPVSYTLPLDDVIDACKSEYKGIIDIIFVSRDLDKKAGLKEAFEALRILQNEFKDFIIIISKVNTPYAEQREIDDCTEDVINFGPFKCIDNNPYFSPYPYTTWIRFVYCSNKYFDDSIIYGSYIYRINTEISIVKKTISYIRSNNPCPELMNYYEEYLKSLEEMK